MRLNRAFVLKSRGPSVSLESAFASPSAWARKIDGRHLRSERTRLAIIEAYLELLRRDSVTLTASHIATQADCSVRSIFLRFSDLDALKLAAADYAIALDQAEAVARKVDGDRPTRIQSHVETRARACEKWLSLWRIIANLDQVSALRARVVMVRRANITRIRLMFEPELSCLSEPVREQLLFALDGLTSFETWDQMRHCYGLSMEVGQSVWRSAIDRMLPSGP